MDMHTRAHPAQPVSRLHWLAPCLALLLAAGCATVDTAPSAAPEHAAALAQLDQGQAQAAAERLEAIAASARGAQRNALLADAAFAWHEAGQTDQARRVAAQLDPRRVAGPSRARLALMQAEQALAAQQPGNVPALLAGNPATLPLPLQARWHLALAAAHASGGDVLAAAAARARADAALQGEPRLQNHRAIERLLSSLDDNALAARAAALPAGDPLYNFAARALVRRGLAPPRAFELGDAWKFDQRPPGAADGYRPPRKLAVLLPLSGQLATAAVPVRDGLLAGYFGEQRARPDIVFLDTAGTPQGAQAAYARAEAEGADFVIGPLGRDEVTALFQGQPGSVPTLALNRASVAAPPGHAMFSLAPEDDGVAAADYLLARERSRVLVIAGTDENGQRAAEAFAARLGERGGEVTATIEVGDTPGNLAARLSQAAAGSQAVFLAVRGPQARALAPQLAAAGLGTRPRVGTSQLTSGTGNPTEDAALDGIVYPTEAWPSRGAAGLPQASIAAAAIPSARGAAARLFAFGYDAWRIAAYLEHLATRADGQLAGATGDLRLDGFGNVVRQPAWGTFSSGTPVPLTR